MQRNSWNNAHNNPINSERQAKWQYTAVSAAACANTLNRSKFHIWHNSTYLKVHKLADLPTLAYAQWKTHTTQFRVCINIRLSSKRTSFVQESTVHSPARIRRLSWVPSWTDHWKSFKIKFTQDKCILSVGMRSMRATALTRGFIVATTSMFHVW